MGLSVYEFSEGMRSITRRSYAELARFEPGSGRGDAWRAEQTWSRELSPSGDTRRFSADPVRSSRWNRPRISERGSRSRSS
jgi:hypothetical protein